MDPLLESLLAVVADRPNDVPLRLHVAGLLLDGDRAGEALAHVSAVLQLDPGNRSGLDLLRRASASLGSPSPAPAAETPPVVPPVSPPASADANAETADAEDTDSAPKPASEFDWTAAEAQVGDIVQPAFVDGAGAGGEAEAPRSAYDVERPTFGLADVGGMTEVKERLEVSFLTPMRNPELRRLYGTSLRGGLLLYGPPGCGKTYLARALAGELGAHFLSVGLNDVLDMYIGQSERNLHEIFEIARRTAPCVLFLDEIDALGQKRTQTRGSAMRGTVNQLLTEMDDVHAANEGVYVLAATNHPWDVDTALRRPGRLDRMVLVTPPDEAARAAVLRVHLRDRHVAGIDLAKLAKSTDGFSGADLAHLCDTAAQHAISDSVRSGTVRPIGMDDLQAALKEVRPSTGPWFEVARNVAQFANEGGAYDDLVGYMRKRKML